MKYSNTPLIHTFFHPNSIHPMNSFDFCSTKLGQGEHFFLIQVGEADVEVNGKKVATLKANVSRLRFSCLAEKTTADTTSEKMLDRWSEEYLQYEMI